MSMTYEALQMMTATITMQNRHEADTSLKQELVRAVLCGVEEALVKDGHITDIPDYIVTLMEENGLPKNSVTGYRTNDDGSRAEECDDCGRYKDYCDCRLS